MYKDLHPSKVLELGYKGGGGMTRPKAEGQRARILWETVYFEEILVNFQQKWWLTIAPPALQFPRLCPRFESITVALNHQYLLIQFVSLKAIFHSWTKLRIGIIVQVASK